MNKLAKDAARRLGYERTVRLSLAMLLCLATGVAMLAIMLVDTCYQCRAWQTYREAHHCVDARIGWFGHKIVCDP